MGHAISKKKIALIGANSILGRSLDALHAHHYVVSHKDSLPWDQPTRASRIINKGNPDIYIICYSALDGIEAQLLQIARAVVEVANKTNAVVIGFVNHKVLGHSEVVFDETMACAPICESGQLQLLYQEALGKAKVPLVFRIGEYVSEKEGVVSSLLKKVLFNNETLIDDHKQFSITSSALIVEAISIVIRCQMIGTYHLAHSNGLTMSDLWHWIQQYARFHNLTLPDVTFGGHKIFSCVLDNKRWNTLSMTEASDWQTALVPYGSAIQSIYGLKQ